MTGAVIKKNFIVFFLLTAAFFSQYFFDVFHKRAPDYPITVLPPKVITALDLGSHSAAGSFLWLNVIQRVGAFRIYPKFADDIKLINEVDPKYGYPYAFAEILLFKGNSKAAIEIGENGIKNVPEDWRIPFYMAMSYHDIADRQNALKYFDMAAKTPGAPEHVKFTAIAYGTYKDVRKQSEAIWLAIYETSNDEVVKERALAYISHYMNLDNIDEAIEKYKAKYKKAPEKINDLITGGVLKEIPEDPFGYEYKIGEHGKAATKFLE